MMVKKKSVRATGSAGKLAKAAAVSARIQILDVRLVETHAATCLKDDELPTQMTVELRTDTSHDEDARLITVLVNIVVCGRCDKTGEADAREAPLKIEARYAVKYRLESAEGLTSENFDAFGELNGVHNCWPYCREYVQSVVTRMGLPPLAIPVFRPVTVDVRGASAKGPQEPTEH